MSSKLRLLAATIIILSAAVQTQAANIGTSLKRFKSVDYRLHGQRVAWSTNDWEYYSESSESYPSFTFEYPADWVFDGYSVFYLPNGNKIAELLPGLGIVKLKVHQTCFDNLVIEPSEKPVIRNVKIGNLGGMKIETLSFQGDSSHLSRTTSFCLSDGKFAFLMHFYSDSRNTGSKKIFDRLISTFRFTHPN